ncbi:hypothetical protein CBW53_19030 [Yersinia frederiksenii]|nr:hypothetical protein CBW53_19030 [Yersinia frederiksenii]
MLNISVKIIGVGYRVLLVSGQFADESFLVFSKKLGRNFYLGIVIASRCWWQIDEDLEKTSQISQKGG